MTSNSLVLILYIYRLLDYIQYYPWRCLCFGFSQITLIEPFLLIILHFSQIGFTDALTFIYNLSFQKRLDLDSIAPVSTECKRFFIYLSKQFCLLLNRMVIIRLLLCRQEEF